MRVTPDAVLKLSLAAGVFLAGAGIGYYYGIFLPAQSIREAQFQIDRGRSKLADRSAVAERGAQQLRLAAQNRYDDCMTAANLAYQQRWSTSCRTQNQRQQAAFDDCADDFFSTREGCARKFPVQPVRGCSLPAHVGNSLVTDRDAARSQCLGELRGGYVDQRQVGDDPKLPDAPMARP